MAPRAERVAGQGRAACGRATPANGLTHDSEVSPAARAAATCAAVQPPGTYGSLVVARGTAARRPCRRRSWVACWNGTPSPVGSGSARCVAEGLALTLALHVERQDEVPGLGQRACRPPVHVLGALDRAGRDDDGGMGAGPGRRTRGGRRAWRRCGTGTPPGSGSGRSTRAGRRPRRPAAPRRASRRCGPAGGRDLSAQVGQERLGRGRGEGCRVRRVEQRKRPAGR